MKKEAKNFNTLFQQINWPRFIAMVFLLWTINSIFSTLQSGLYRAGKGQEVYWMHIFWYTYTSALFWIGFTPLITWIVFRNPIGSKHWRKIFLVHIIFAVIVSFPQRFFHLSLDYYVQNFFGFWNKQTTYWDYLSSSYIGRTVGGILTYFIIAALLYGYFYYLKNIENTRIQAELTTDLNKSRIQNLKHQIQPHFLFNSMQLISNLMYKNLALADEAISKLSDLLRLSIKQLEVDEILLLEEIDAIEKYLHFQKLRFGKKVTSEITCDPVLHSAKVPAMILQPFVENAIQYGFEQTGQATHVKILIKRVEQNLQIDIVDNGPGFDFTYVQNGSGIGIKNVLTRLESLYGTDFSFQIERENLDTRLLISLPFKT